ncbi:AI-2E family transporter [Okibacterium endophyticum]
MQDEALRDHDDGSPGVRLPMLRELGAASWAALGVIALVVVMASAVSALSGILIPLVIAVILGAVLEPVVQGLRRLRVPAALAAAGGLLLSIFVTAGIVAVVVAGFIRQLPEISEQLGEGWRSLYQWARSLDLEASWLEQIRKTIDEAAPQLGSGILGIVTNTVYGVISLGIGCFFAMFFLFFVLRDGHALPSWLARVTGQDEQFVVQIDSAARASLRGYFRGTAVTALITAPIFVIPLLLLGVPLVIPIVILYFFLSFVPYVGAWITGAFAVLIAFGSGGATAAIIVALSLLVSNGTIQSVVSSWALGTALKMHPVAVMLTTLVGGVVAGLLGMILGPPLLSAAQKAMATLAERRTEQQP